MQQYEFTAEASPNTLAGSFTPDLVTSKTWLCNYLKKELGDRSAGDIYVLGSWYGNMGVFLQQANIDFDRLIMVETRQRLLATARRLLDLILQIRQLQHIWDIHQGKDETLPLQMVISYY